ncbi:MAG TPA: energy transducer TonB, partial [Candidatus Polarisedimenticolaceae bacterium]|nr:energy transducer TonB [Candidatus Polarisedimenticolaceae bacterium]
VPQEAAPITPPPADGVAQVEEAPAATEAASPPPSAVEPGAVVDWDALDVTPVPIARPAPEYPALARQMRQEGTVTLRVLVDETGHVADVELVRGISRSRLNDAAIQAARRWTYTPASKDGVPVKVWKSETVIFKR